MGRQIGKSSFYLQADMHVLYLHEYIVAAGTKRLMEMAHTSIDAKLHTVQRETCYNGNETGK